MRFCVQYFSGIKVVIQRSKIKENTYPCHEQRCQVSAVARLAVHLKKEEVFINTSNESREFDNYDLHLGIQHTFIAVEVILEITRMKNHRHPVLHNKQYISQKWIVGCSFSENVSNGSLEHKHSTLTEVELWRIPLWKWLHRWCHNILNLAISLLAPPLILLLVNLIRKPFKSIYYVYVILEQRSVQCLEACSAT